ncbi:class I SAM-dependent methyltransferase [Megalodesulfovibrio paquesii]
MQYWDDVRRFDVEAAGVRWRLSSLADLETLWDRLAAEDGDGDELEPIDPAALRRKRLFEQDERLPYWTELWPSSYLLAQWLEQSAARIRGCRCLDLGCGLGFTALVGCRLGARVTALDYEFEALTYARRNEADNRIHLNGPAPVWLCMDWRAPAFRKQAFDFVWAGDIVYEDRFIPPVADFLDRVVAAEGVAWVAEPDRAVYKPFIAAMHRRGFDAVKVYANAVKARNWPAAGVPASLWEFRRR